MVTWYGYPRLRTGNGERKWLRQKYGVLKGQQYPIYVIFHLFFKEKILRSGKNADLRI
jgi:hypothetical protein